MPFSLLLVEFDKNANSVSVKVIYTFRRVGLATIGVCFFGGYFGSRIFNFWWGVFVEELYWKMYSKLFNTITDVLPLLENTQAVEFLKQAQIDTEEMYVNFEDDVNT